LEFSLSLLRSPVWVVAFLGLGIAARAQELEPRAYSISPVGVNFVSVSYSRMTGDISFDPSIPIEDANSKLNRFSSSYFRSIDVFGRSGNVAVVTNYVEGDLQGTVNGEFTAVRRSGLADSGARFAVNLVGAPAMKLKEFASYRQKTNLGISMTVVAPLGQYDPVKFVNIGSNRWSFKPEIGLSRALRQRRLVLDAYLGVWLFSPNRNYVGRTRTQDPIMNTQFHLSYNLTPRAWVAFDVNFFTGGRTTVDGVAGNDLQHNSRLGGTLSVPFSRRQSMKFGYSFGAYTTVGANFHSISAGYQYLWGAGL
jgi:Putative MetA-pathway of phenol degradation